MKKFFIPLFLFVGFLISIPQIALADSLKEKYSHCLQEHKFKLPKEYKGPNLKLIKEIEEPPLARGLTKPDNSFNTGNKYFIDVVISSTTHVLSRESSALNCDMEYVYLTNGWNVNVIDVPIGSHLRYIPETDEMQLFLPKEDFNIEDNLGLSVKLLSQIQQGLKKKKERDLECIAKKKEKLLADYTGPNLKYETVLNFRNDELRDHCMKRFSSVYTTKNKYTISLQNKKITEWGLMCDCEEYIDISANDGEKRYVYKVTNIPLGSTLKYIPETREMQVIAPQKESIEKEFKEEIKRKEKLKST